MTAQLTLDLTAAAVEPLAAQRATVRAVIEASAAEHGGVVSSNDVRSRLVHTDVPPRLIGQVYRVLRGAGHLVEIGTERSTDVKGGNAGKHVPLYRWEANP